VGVALGRANIIPEILGLLPPDDAINLKEPGVMTIPCAAQDRPVPGPVLAVAFALGDPLQYGRQGLILHHDHTGLLHHLRDNLVRAFRWQRRAEDSGDNEQQTTQHEGYPAACAPGPPALETACACGQTIDREAPRGVWRRCSLDRFMMRAPSG
jgi:hypothetical protein